jgi:hypothetical protein
MRVLGRIKSGPRDGKASRRPMERVICEGGDAAGGQKGRRAEGQNGRVVEVRDGYMIYVMMYNTSPAEIW